MRQTTWMVLIGTVGVLGSSLPGCKPKEGDSCEEGAIACVDEHNKLSCEDGKFVASPCRGENGCQVEDGLLTCDISGNAAGDPCSKADEGHAACAPDGTHALRCHEGRLVKEPCHGPKGCEQSASGPACDHSVAEENQPCGPAARNRSACSLDNTHALICKEGKFVAEYPCRGPKGCRLTDGRPTCDRSVAAEGESCGRLPKNSKSCSADGKAVLVCQVDQFVMFRPCPGPKGCQVTDKGLTCDGNAR